MNHNQVAASVRKNKEKHPEKYCQYPQCLYRIEGLCPKHSRGGYVPIVKVRVTEQLIRDGGVRSSK